MELYTGLCIFSLLTILCSAVQFESESSQAATDYDYNNSEGRHAHGALLKKKKKLKKEFKRKKKILAGCLVNSKFKRSVSDAQQRTAWSDEQKAAINEVALQRIKRDRPQGRFLIPIPIAVQYTNVQTGYGGGGHSGGGSSSSSSSSGYDEDYGGGDNECDIGGGGDSDKFSDRFVGPYHANDVYRQLYRNFMRWVL